MPKNLVAQLCAKSFEFVNGVDAEQEFVDVQKLYGKFARHRKRIDAANGFAWFKMLNALNILETRQVMNVVDDVNNFVDSGVEFGAIDVFVTSVSVMVTAREINGGSTQFWRNERYVGERTLRSLETFACDVLLEFGIGAVVENSVVFSFTVKLDNELERIQILRKLLLLVSKAESLGTKSTYFLVARKEQPRLNLRGMEDVTKSENATSIVAANALRTYQNVVVSGNANVVDRFFMNGVQMSDE